MRALLFQIILFSFVLINCLYVPQKRYADQTDTKSRDESASESIYDQDEEDVNLNEKTGNISNIEERQQPPAPPATEPSGSMLAEKRCKEEFRIVAMNKFGPFNQIGLVLNKTYIAFLLAGYSVIPPRFWITPPEDLPRGPDNEVKHLQRPRTMAKVMFKNCSASKREHAVLRDGHYLIFTENVRGTLMHVYYNLRRHFQMLSKKRWTTPGKLSESPIFANAALTFNEDITSMFFYEDILFVVQLGTYQGILFKSPCPINSNDVKFLTKYSLKDVLLLKPQGTDKEVNYKKDIDTVWIEYNANNNIQLHVIYSQFYEAVVTVVINEYTGRIAKEDNPIFRNINTDIMIRQMCRSLSLPTFNTSLYNEGTVREISTSNMFKTIWIWLISLFFLIVGLVSLCVLISYIINAISEKRKESEMKTKESRIDSQKSSSIVGAGKSQSSTGSPKKKKKEPEVDPETTAKTKEAVAEAAAKVEQEAAETPSAEAPKEGGKRQGVRGKKKGLSADLGKNINISSREDRTDLEPPIHDDNTKPDRSESVAPGTQQFNLNQGGKQ